MPPRPRHDAPLVRVLTALLALGSLLTSAAARTDPPAEGVGALAERADAAVREVLTRTGVPSASIALVRGGAIAYVQAYGLADLETQQPATPATRYAIGSISKEFTAAALLQLQEQHRLRLDDAAGRYLPRLGPAGRVSLRALLSHTGGVRDYWPQDYVPPELALPASHAQVLERWARGPLDFASGADWQYSNTGYVLAGTIAEQVGHAPLFAQMQARIFEPLQMHSVFDIDGASLPDADARGYTRFALGAPRRAVKEGAGWLFAAGQLAMTPSDLARWDIALMQGRLLTPTSLRQLTTEILLNSGVGTHYALGLRVTRTSGRRLLEHGGEVSGFGAFHRLYPDHGLAVVVLTNQDVSSAAGEIGEALAQLLLDEGAPEDAAAIELARRVYAGLQQGALDPALLTPNGRSYFTAQALADYASSLGGLGTPTKFVAAGADHRGGLVTRRYLIGYEHATLEAVVRSTPVGLIEQYTISPQ